MKIHPTFPPHRRRDPRRRSEGLVYDLLAQSDVPGQALYELKATPEAPELDFPIWFQDRARIGLQVKGGPYSVNGAVWSLRTIHGVQQVDCPLPQTWDAAIAVRDAIHRELGFQVFIIPVMLFTDTPRDPIIEDMAWRYKVKVLFGVDDLVDCLLALADQTVINYPPTADHIMNEVDAVTGGLVAATRDEVEGPAGVLVDRQQGTLAQDNGLEGTPDLMPRQVVIHHVDTVNIHVASALGDGRDQQVPPTS